MPKYQTVVFVNGCFWHAHEGCPYFKISQSNIEYWMEKFQSNKKRDKDIYEQLKNMNWRVLVVWECQLKSKMVRDDTLKQLYEEIVYRNAWLFETD